MLAKVQAQMNDTEKNPRDGEPGGLPSMGSHRVGHDWSDLAAAAAAAEEENIGENHCDLVVRQSS